MGDLAAMLVGAVVGFSLYHVVIAALENVIFEDNR
jgi:hypothetical protein